MLVGEEGVSKVLDEKRRASRLVYTGWMVEERWMGVDKGRVERSLVYSDGGLLRS